MKDNDWRAYQSSCENDFSLKKKCISCHQWKSQLEFISAPSGDTNVCADCRKKQQFRDEFPKFQWRKCKSCDRFKEPSKFIGDSDVCLDCQKIRQPIQDNLPRQKRCIVCNHFKNQFEFIGDSDICTSCQGLIPPIPESPAHSKMCVCCNELKDKSEFPIPTSGDARICYACLRRYPPIEKPDQLWIGLIIGFIVGAIVL